MAYSIGLSGIQAWEDSWAVTPNQARRNIHHYGHRDPRGRGRLNISDVLCIIRRSEQLPIGYQWVMRPSNHPTVMHIRLLYQKLEKRSPKPNVHIGFGNRVVFSSMSIHDSRWATGDVKVENMRAIVCVAYLVYLSLLTLSASLRSSFALILMPHDLYIKGSLTRNYSESLIEISNALEDGDWPIDSCARQMKPNIWGVRQILLS